jgi:hypothetical protein
MTDESPDDPARTSDADAREQEHQRRNRLQAELFRLAFDRSRHAAFIEEALRRARREREADESRDSSGC